MLVNDIIYYCRTGKVVIENETEEETLYHFERGYIGDIPFDIATKRIDKIYSENDILFISVID